MRNEQSVFPDNIDPLIFYSDADLDNQHYLAHYYSLLESGDYVGASQYIQSIDEDIDFYGAWLLNLIENELYAVENYIDQHITPEPKPKLVHHGANEPSDPAYTHWVYYNVSQ